MLAQELVDGDKIIIRQNDLMLVYKLVRMSCYIIFTIHKIRPCLPHKQMYFYLLLDIVV